MSVRDPWFDAMEVVLGAMEAASKRGSRRGVSDAHASPGLTNPTRRKHRTPVGVKWIASTIGRAVVADVGRLVLATHDARHGIDVLEVVQWGPRTKAAAHARIDLVTASERVLGVGAFVGELRYATRGTR